MNVNVQNAQTANIAKSVNKLNCPDNAYKHDNTAIANVALAGTPFLLNLPNAAGKFFCSPKV